MEHDYSVPEWIDWPDGSSTKQVGGTLFVRSAPRPALHIWLDRITSLTWRVPTRFDYTKTDFVRNNDKPTRENP